MSPGRPRGRGGDPTPCSSSAEAGVPGLRRSTALSPLAEPWLHSPSAQRAASAIWGPADCLSPNGENHVLAVTCLRSAGMIVSP